jgi:hypothetical protein
MAITFVSSTRSPTSFPGSANNTSSCTINKPAGVVANDVLVAFMETGAADISTPSGWTLIDSFQTGSSSMTSNIYYKVVTGSEGSSFSFTDNGGDLAPLCGAIVAYRGCDVSGSPIDVQADADGGTSDPRTGPSVTTTAASARLLYFRAGKTSSVGSEGTWSVSGTTMRQRFSNRGNSTQYYCEIHDDNADVTAGLHTGKSFNGSLTLTGSIDRTIALKALAEPASGDVTATLPSVTSSFAATRVMPDGPITATLPSVSASFDGLAAPPSGPMDATLPGVSSSLSGVADGAGTVSVTLPSVSSSLAGEIIHGSLSATLPGVTTALAGGVEPIGGITATLPFLSAVEFTVETQPFGAHVIHVEHESRAFRVTDEDEGLIYLRSRDDVNTA